MNSHTVLMRAELQLDLESHSVSPVPVLLLEVRSGTASSCRDARKATWSYMIKPHGSLVLVSSALLRYTPNLSTT